MWRLLAGLALGLLVAIPSAVLTVTLGLDALRGVVELGQLSELAGKGLAEKSFVRTTLRANRIHLAGWYPSESAALIVANDAPVYVQLRKPDYEQLEREGRFELIGYVSRAVLGMPGVEVAGPELVHWPSGLTTWRQVATCAGLAVLAGVGAGWLIRSWRAQRVSSPT